MSQLPVSTQAHASHSHDGNGKLRVNAAAHEDIIAVVLQFVLRYLDIAWALEATGFIYEVPSKDGGILAVPAQHTGSLSQEICIGLTLPTVTSCNNFNSDSGAQKAACFGACQHKHAYVDITSAAFCLDTVAVCSCANEVC